MLFAAVHESGNGTEGTFHLRLPTSAHWARPDVSRTYPYTDFGSFTSRSDAALGGPRLIITGWRTRRRSRVHGRVPSALGENLTVADDTLRYVKDGHTLAHAIIDTVREPLIVLDRTAHDAAQRAPGV